MSVVYIKEIKMVNFKTHKNARIRFSKGVNVITGPNGAGKSNIIEAIIFALGERNPRKFRATNFNQLIFKKAQEKYMSVSITISSGEEDHQFKRVITVEGKHKYYYNGKRISRAGYLSQLLKIGEEGLNFKYIPQGSVLAAATIGPQELRQLIDEVLGITEYNERKKRALETLSEARSKLETILAKTEVIKENINSLFKQMLLADRSDIINKYINLIEAAKITRDIDNLRKRRKELEKEIEKLNDRLHKLNIKIDNIEKEINTIKTEKSQLENILDQKRDYEYREILSQISNIRDIENKKISDIKRLEFSLSIMNNNLKTFNKEIERTENEINNIQIKKEKLEKEINELLAEKKNLEIQKQKLNNKIEILKNSLNELEKNLFSDVEIRKTLKNISSIFIKEDQINYLREEESYLHNRLNNINVTIDKLNKFKEELYTERNEYNKKLKSLIKKRKSLINKIKSLEDEIEKAEKLLHAAEKEITKLKVIKRYGLYSEIEEDAQFIYNLVKDLRIQGVIGILGSKIKGPKEIINILRRILWEKWYAIIVKDQDSAFKISDLAMKYNRKIVIVTLESYKKKEIKIPENSIVHFIKYPEILTPLILHLLSNVIMITNLDDALSMLSKGYDVVDRRGRFYIYRGEFHIGEKVITRKTKLNIKQFEDILSDFRNMIKVRKKDYKEYIRELNDVSSKLSELKSEILSLTEIIKTVDYNISILKNIAVSYEKRLSDLKKKYSHDLKEIEEIEKKVGLYDLISGIKKLEKEKTELEKEIDNIRREIYDVNRNIDIIENTVKLYSNNIESLQNLQTTYSKKVNALRRRIKGILRGIERINKLINDKKKELKQVKEKEKEILLIKKRLDKDIEKIRAQLTRLSLKLDELDKRKYYVYSKLTDIEKEKIRLEREFIDVSKEINRCYSERSKLGYENDVELYDFSYIEKLLIDLKGEKSRIGEVNPLAKREYIMRVEPYKEIATRREELRREEKAILSFIDEIDKKREKLLFDGLNKINAKMNSIFMKIFENAKLSIELEEEGNIDSGLILNVLLPGKPQLPVASLSGGEKSLTLVTFLIAINAINKDTILLLDEIDAHIDPNNVTKFAKAIKEEGMENQIIMVSLKPPVIEIADNIIGVTVREGVSKCIQLPREVIKIHER